VAQAVLKWRPVPSDLVIERPDGTQATIGSLSVTNSDFSFFPG
jgi:hypothetical protein